VLQRPGPAYHSSLGPRPEAPNHATVRGPSGCAGSPAAWRLRIQFCRRRTPSHGARVPTPSNKFADRPPRPARVRHRHLRCLSVPRYKPAARLCGRGRLRFPIGPGHFFCALNKKCPSTLTSSCPAWPSPTLASRMSVCRPTNPLTHVGTWRRQTHIRPMFASVMLTFIRHGPRKSQPLRDARDDNDVPETPNVHSRIPHDVDCAAPVLYSCQALTPYRQSTRAPPNLRSHQHQVEIKSSIHPNLGHQLLPGHLQNSI